MKKIELEFQKEELRTRRFLSGIALIKSIFRGGFIVLSIYVALQGLQPFAGKGSELIIGIIRELKLGVKISIALNIIIPILWYIERKGKQRAIRLKAKLQHELESSDLFRSSSELTEKGTTPKEED